MAEHDSGHIPVLADELIQTVQPRAGQCVLDCTIGPGGHAARLLQLLGPTGRLVGLDLDEQNLAAARARLKHLAGRLELYQLNFADLDAALQRARLDRVDLILADLGLSSNQIDDPHRGFSFAVDGPLDMRIDRRQRLTAAELVNGLSERELAEIIWRFSQERFSRKIARRICQVRRAGRITTTAALARVVCSALRVDPRSRRSRIHPATRTFLALRIAVNRELENLATLLQKAPRYLNPGGKLAVISFHSLEDRSVKHDFRRRSKEGIYRIVTAKPVTPSPAERQANPRCRSAKLRVAERTDKPINRTGPELPRQTRDVP